MTCTRGFCALAVSLALGLATTASAADPNATCMMCHADVSADKLPHPQKLKPPVCASRHERAVKDDTATVHGKARAAGKALGASCTGCHGAHHVRPEKFPMGLAIFAGRVSEHELKDERPQKYERLAREGRLAQFETAPPSAASMAFGRVVDGAALVLGLVMIVST